MTDAFLSAGVAPSGAARTSLLQPGPAGRHARYTGRGWELFWIYLKNLLLSFLTLGIYRFWGKTRIRRYVWSHLLFLEEPFEYSGTGKELFLGFLKAMLVLIPLFIGFGLFELFLVHLDPGLTWISQLLQMVTILALTFLATYAARRYRMSRTLWRGIRFQLAGSAWTYLGLALGGLLLTMLTLGLYLPFMNVRLKHYEMNNLSFGSERFVFDGEGRDLFKPFLLAWLLTIPTLYLSQFRFAAQSYRYYASRLSIAGLRFAMPVTGWQVARLYIGNFLLLVVSLGLLYPLIVKRMANFWCDNLTIEGTVDFAAIEQAARGPQTGEGLASYFGMDGMGV